MISIKTKTLGLSAAVLAFIVDQIGALLRKANAAEGELRNRKWNSETADIVKAHDATVKEHAQLEDLISTLQAELSEKAADASWLAAILANR